MILNKIYKKNEVNTSRFDGGRNSRIPSDAIVKYNKIYNNTYNNAPAEGTENNTSNSQIMSSYAKQNKLAQLEHDIKSAHYPKAEANMSNNTKSPSSSGNTTTTILPPLAASRKGKIVVIRTSAEEFPDIFHAKLDGNLYPCEVRCLLNIFPKSKTNKEKKKYEDDRAKNRTMKFPSTRSPRTKKLKVTWKPEALPIDSIQYADSSGSNLHNECDSSKDELSSCDTKSQFILQNPRGIANSTTPTGRRKEKKQR